MNKGTAQIRFLQESDSGTNFFHYKDQSFSCPLCKQGAQLNRVVPVTLIDKTTSDKFLYNMPQALFTKVQELFKKPKNGVTFKIKKVNGKYSIVSIKRPMLKKITDFLKKLFGKQHNWWVA